MTQLSIPIPRFLEKISLGSPIESSDLRTFILHLHEISNEQIGAFLAHVFHKGLSTPNVVALTLAMRDSGKSFDWNGLGKPVVDKHSTGGVGDKISLCLAPILAAFDLAVPMISGRGLGFTGGTLDKLEAIPGFSTSLSFHDIQKQVRKLGLAFGRQTEDIAPADRKLYSIRDITGTVESLHLITASILSKKLSETLDFLIMDVKWGSGAFMRTLEEARALAKSLVNVAVGAGTPTSACITSMNQPLGSVSGHWCETAEAVQLLKSGGKLPEEAHDVWTVTLKLASLVLGHFGLASNEADAKRKLETMVASGRPFEIWCQVVASQGGQAKLFESPIVIIPKTRHSIVLKAPTSGFIQSMCTRNFGFAKGLAGGGREKSTDSVDPHICITYEKKIGAKVKSGDTLCTMHTNVNTGHDAILKLLAQAYEITETQPTQHKLIEEVL